MYDKTIPVISQLQHHLSDYSDFMQSISILFDPKYAFLIYAPIAFILNPMIGKRLILAAVLAEWSNQVLKWISFGERPYWYVHSSSKFDPQTTPIFQYPVTCETGPGAPSGHSQLTAAIWLVILESVGRMISEAYQMKNTRRVTVTLRCFYVALVLLVAISRVFVACHFPQQCIAGAILGFAIAKFALRSEPSAFHMIGLSAFMLSSVFGCFALMTKLGFDLSWTFELASKHCTNQEYIHIDSTPFFSIMRYCGFALGSGLGLLVPSYQNSDTGDEEKIVYGPQDNYVESTKQVEVETQELDRSKPFRRNAFGILSTKIALVLIAARLLENLNSFVSPSDLNLFYPVAFSAYTLFSFGIVVV